MVYSARVIARCCFTPGHMYDCDIPCTIWRHRSCWLHLIAILTVRSGAPAAMGVDIFTQGTTLDELMHNVKDAVELHFEETIDAGEQITVVSLTELQVGSIARISGC